MGGDSGLGPVIDGVEFSRVGRSLGFSLGLASMPRLADLLVDSRGAVECQVLGEVDGEGNAFLVLAVAGCLSLRCQRCLGVLTHSLQIEARLLLVSPGQDWPDDELIEDGFDAVAAEREMALLPMVEEEILLALPLAPCHETCEPPAVAVETDDPSPFAVLAKLKKGV